jgi:hypothetical protein
MSQILSPIVESLELAGSLHRVTAAAGVTVMKQTAKFRGLMNTDLLSIATGYDRIRGAA